MSTSVVPDVKARLVALLEASLDLADVDVQYSAPDELKRETIYFGRTSSTSTMGPMVAGRKRRDESCQLTVIIRTAVPGRSAEEADRRAWALFEVLDDICANDHSLIGARGDDVQRLDPIPGLLHVEMTSYENAPEGDIEGYVGVIAAVLTVTARLT